MSSLPRAFSGQKAFMPFITGGDPDLETTERLLYALRDAGAGAIEIGVPFSDPIAEGPVIEAASARALLGGCTPAKLFDLAARVGRNLDIPLLFMTYYNPVLACGPQAFAERAAAAGLAGLIVPDLPFEERDELLEPCGKCGLDLISLISPTSDERIADIARRSTGFLYCVSSLGVTGQRRELGDDARRMIGLAREVSRIPCAVGFGISTPEQARAMAEFADGVIVGSAIVSQIAAHGRACVPPVAQFARSLKQAMEG